MEDIGVKPLRDLVLVKPAPKEEKTATGLFIPTTAQKNQNKGTVIAIGPGKYGEKLSIEKGDSVLYYIGAGMPYEKDGEVYVFLNEGEIIAKV